MRRRPFRVTLIAALLLLGVDTAGWLYAQHVLEQRLTRLEAAALQAGWQFTGMSGRHGGWPLSATRTVLSPGLHPRGSAWSGGWTGARLTAGLSLLHPDEMTIRLGGAQSFSKGLVPAASDPAGTLRFIGDDLVLAIPLRRQVRHVHLAATRLRVALPAGPGSAGRGTRALGLASLRIDHLDGSLRWTDAAIALDLAARDLEVAGGPGAPGFDAGTGLLEASLVGRPGSPAPDWEERLQAWRNNGGRLIVTRAALRWPDARIELAGDAALDGNLRPDGAFSLHLLGADALLDMAMRRGLISAAQATSIRAVLGLLSAATDAPGHGQSLTLPLDLHDGTLSLGHIPLLQVPLFTSPATAAPAPVTLPSP